MMDIGNYDALWDHFVEADEANYILAAGTFGSSDTVYNECGVAKGHAYSIIHTFTMTDEAGDEHRCLLMRNPWG